MNNIVNVLIVDDHSMIMDAYAAILSNAFVNYDFIFDKSTNCEEAFNIVNYIFKNNRKIDIAILDLSLPAYKKGKLESGKDLGEYIKIKFPSCKIMIITQNSEGYLLNKTFRELKPEGFVNKADIDADNFPNVFMDVLKGESYLSETINKAIIDFNDSKIKLDEIDFKILSLLEKGIKTKELPNHINLSLSAIEKRKAKIKFYLTGDKVNDDEMLKISKMLKFS